MADTITNIPGKNIKLVDNGDGTYSISVALNEEVTVNMGDVTIENVGMTSLPAGNLGQQSKTDSLSVVPAVDIPDGTYLGDIKFGEEIPIGDNKIGSINIRNNANDANIDPLAESTFTARIGEVQATPTENTLLRRIKDLLTGIVLSAGTNLIGKVGIDQTTANANEVVIKSAIPAGTNQIGKTGFTLKKISVPFTRPADTTAYAVNDAITNSTSAPTVFQLDLASIGAVAGQSVEIRKLAVVSSASPSTKILAKAFLSATTFTATNDNSPLDIDDTTMKAGGSWFDCDISNYTVSNSRCANIGVHEPIVLASGDTKLYGTLQANIAYTPTSEEEFTIIAWVALL